MRRFFAAAAVAVAFLCGSASSVEAAFAATITTTAGSQTIVDGGSGDLDGLTDGSITINYKDSAYALVGTISFNNSPGTATKAILDVSYNIRTFNASGNTTGGAATLVVSAQDFTSPLGSQLPFVSTFDGNGHGVGTITSQAYIDTANGLFATSGPTVSTTGAMGPFNINGSYGGESGLTFDAGVSYSITEKLSFNLTPGSNASGDVQDVVSVPGPAGLLLALTGAPVLGLGAWLRRRGRLSSI